MPSLPNITVSDAAYAHLLELFNNDPAAYREWLRSALKERLLNKRLAEAAAREATTRSAVVDQVEADMA